MRDISRSLQKLLVTSGHPLLDAAARVRQLVASRHEIVGNLYDEAHGGILRETVAEAAATDSSPDWKGRLLFELVRRHVPNHVVEFGTAFGVGTAHLAAGIIANGSGEVTTVEGSKARQDVARHALEEVSLSDVVRFRQGFFEEHLDALGGAGFLYIDGHHYYEPTMRYVDAALQQGGASMVLALDDIAGYSDEMDRAWAELRRDRRFKARGQVQDLGVLVCR